MQGKRIRTEHLEVRILASPVLHPRIGFIVPMYGHTAVERNRLKRRLREIVRTQLLAELLPIDMIVRTQRNAYDASFDTLADQLSQAAARNRKLR